MATAGGANIAVDGLVFGYDTGYPLVSGNSNTYKFNKGEPTVNIVTNPTFLGTSGTQTTAVSANWGFSGYTGDTGFKFYNNSTSPIPLKFPNEGVVITTGTNDVTNRRIYYNGTVEPDTTYTLSYWVYSTALSTASNYFFIYTSDGSDAGSTAIGQSIPTGEWKFIQESFTTTSTTSNARSVNWGPVLSRYSATLFAMQRFQIEAKAHATPFTTNIRSVSGSLIDLTRTTDIDVSNVSFDSNAQITFDGTDDYIDLGIKLQDLVGTSPTAITFEFVAKADNLTNPIGITGDYIGPAGTGFGIKRGSSSNKLEFRVYATGGIPNSTSNIPTGRFFHGVCLWDGTGTGYHKIYFNGELEATDTSPGTTWNHGLANLRIGDAYNSMGNPAEWQGEIPVFKIYNRALSAQEVLQNYNALKERFSL